MTARPVTAERMNAAILAKSVHDRRRALVGNSVGLVALAVWVGAVFAIVRESDAFTNFVENLPPAMLAVFGLDPATFLTAAGFLGAYVYSLFAPLLVLLFVIGAVTGELAGEDRSGALDMLLATPVSRSRLLLEKAGAVGLAALGLVAVMTLALLAANPVFDMDLAVSGVLAAGASLWLLGVLFGSLALAVGAFTGRPTVAGGVAGGVALVAWLINSFAGLFPWLEGPGAASPFTWYLAPDLLIGGLNAGHLWLLLGTAALTVVATRLFARRDLSVVSSALPSILPARISGRRKRSRIRRPRSPRLLAGPFRKTLWDRRRSVWLWGGGLGLLTLTMFSAWPALEQDAEAMEALLTSFPREVFAMFGMTNPEAIVTPAGLVSSRTHQSIGPLLVIVFALRGVSMALVKEEAGGVLDLVLAGPATRRRLVAAKAAGIALSTAVVVLIPAVTAMIGDALWETGIGAGNILSAAAGLGLLGLLFGGLAMLLWAVAGSSFPSVRVSGLVALATFLLNGLGSLTDALAPVRAISPFNWFFGDAPPLAKGFEPSYLLLLVGAVAAGWIAVHRSSRRDLST